MTKQRPKVGSGYAQWRPPSRAATFVRRWWWAGAIIVAVSAAVTNGVARTRALRMDEAARVATQTRRGSLQEVLAYVSTHPIKPVEPPTARMIMAGFISSLSNEQVGALAARRDLKGDDLSVEQKETLLRYLRATHSDPQGRVVGDIEGMEVDSVGYSVEGPGPGLILRRYRPRDNARGQAFFAFPPEWRGGS